MKLKTQKNDQKLKL